MHADQLFHLLCDSLGAMAAALTLLGHLRSRPLPRAGRKPVRWFAKGGGR